MSVLIQFIETITPGNCFLIVILGRGERFLLRSSNLRRTHTHTCSVWASKKQSCVQQWECVSCVWSLESVKSWPEPGGCFPPSLRLSTSFKSLNVSLLPLTSHHHPSQWSPWETSSLPLSPSYLHPSIFSSSHDCFLSLLLHVKSRAARLGKESQSGPVPCTIATVLKTGVKGVYTKSGL